MIGIIVIVMAAGGVACLVTGIKNSTLRGEARASSSQAFDRRGRMTNKGKGSGSLLSTGVTLLVAAIVATFLFNNMLWDFGV